MYTLLLTQVPRSYAFLVILNRITILIVWYTTLWVKLCMNDQWTTSLLKGRHIRSPFYFQYQVLSAMLRWPGGRRLDAVCWLFVHVLLHRQHSYKVLHMKCTVHCTCNSIKYNTTVLYFPCLVQDFWSQCLYYSICWSPKACGHSPLDMLLKAIFNNYCSLRG